MDITNRSFMEGFTAEISAVPDLPQALPAIGEVGNVQSHCKRAGI